VADRSVSVPMTLLTLSLSLSLSNIRLQKCHDLENGIMGPSRSLEMSPFGTAHATSY